MPVIKNQIAGHLNTLDFANVSYNVSQFSVNTSIETVQRMGVSKIFWTGDWNIKQGANVIFQTAAGTSGTWDLSAQGIVLQGSNTSANITANNSGSTSNCTLIMTITKYANNNAGVGN